MSLAIKGLDSDFTQKIIFKLSEWKSILLFLQLRDPDQALKTLTSHFVKSEKKLHLSKRKIDKILSSIELLNQDDLKNPML